MGIWSLKKLLEILRLYTDNVELTIEAAQQMKEDGTFDRLAEE